MNVIPAIDLRGGCCVRLQQGDFDRETRYDADPLALAQRYADAGARWLHVVDLDGARDGSMGNRDIIARLSQIDGLRIQTGGGVRTEADVSALLELGVGRVVIGSVAVRDAATVCGWIEKFGSNHITVALDVRWMETEFRVAVDGWTQTAGISLWNALGPFSKAKLRHLLCTDIGRDGMLSGPNVVLYRSLADRLSGLKIQASGGVAGAEDLPPLARTGVAGVVVGKALLDGRLSLEALASPVRSRG